MGSARTIILVSLLCLEAALVVSLRTLGWFGTGNAIHWIGCLIATTLPLAIASLLLTRHRGQFGLRSLLTSIALVAVFLWVSVLPLVEFYSERTMSKNLAAAGATLKTESELASFHTELGLAVRPNSPWQSITNLPPWLQPFVGNIAAIPADKSVRDVWLSSDEHIRILCDQPSRFESLETLSITSGVTPDGLAFLQESLPQFQQLVAVCINDVSVPEHWYATLRNVRTLFVWAEGQLRGCPFPSSDLHDIASLPELDVLMVLGYGLNDSDTQVLTRSTSLKRIILCGTAVTADGETALEDEMPNCLVHRD